MKHLPIGLEANLRRSCRRLVECKAFALAVGYAASTRPIDGRLLDIIGLPGFPLYNHIICHDEPGRVSEATLVLRPSMRQATQIAPVHLPRADSKRAQPKQPSGSHVDRLPCDHSPASVR